jgi:hypothetical protein
VKYFIGVVVVPADRTFVTVVAATAELVGEVVEQHILFQVLVQD